MTITESQRSKEKFGKTIATSMFCLGVPVGILGWISTENEKEGKTKKRNNT